MIIDYNAVEWKENPGFKGGEGSFNNKMYDDGTNKMMKGCLKPGCSIGKLIQDDEEFEVSPEQCLYCPEGHSHSLINNGTEDLVFFAAVPKQ